MHDIEALGIGTYYKAGDKDDLKAKMQVFISNPLKIKECGSRAREYALKHTYADYCKQLAEYIGG